MTTNKQLRELAEGVKHWGSSIADAWPSDPDSNDTWSAGAIDEDGNKYPVIEVDADQYDAPGDSERLARFFTAANPATVLALLDAYEALQAECALMREQLDAMAEYKVAAHQLIGIPASVGISEPIEGFAKRPQDIMPAVRDMALRIELLEHQAAERERLLAESRANDQQAMAYLSEVRALVGSYDFPDMVRRCEKLQAECKRLRAAMIEAKGHISHYMYGGSAYREPAAKAIALIDDALQEAAVARSALSAHREQQGGDV